MAEPEHGRVRVLTDLTMSAIAQVEVPAALWRKQRTGELSVGEARLLTEAFADDVEGHEGTRPRFAIVGVSPGILDGAARLVARRALRAYDAVQLATALAVATTVPGTRFVSFDTQLNAAAAAEGLQLL
ncbi:MAG: type II toxin-antitoxin system VapC family toxin [Actinomycetota bacterium]|nr:type II toxin-antitoxin system VapC family toxin [Actinomycetota bacterium]